jgi:hypothetical protein
MVGRTSLYAVVPVLLLACGAPDPAPPPSSKLAGLLPTAAELPEWQVAEGPVSYLPEDLYEYLNGGAERYLTSGFRELLHVRFRHGDDPLAGVTIDIFDMGDELGAFGMYRSALPAEAEWERWCAEGYHSGSLAAAWKGSTYVRGEADEERPELLELRDHAIARACDRMPGDASLPAVLDPLPPDGRVARSERWVASNLLGHAFLEAGVLASYEVGGHDAQLYLSDAGSESAAADAVARLRVHHAEWGEVESSAESVGVEGFRFTDPTLGSGTVVRAGRFVAGVHGDVPYDVQERLLARLVVGLESLRGDSSE